MSHASALFSFLLLPALLVAQKPGTTEQVLKVEGKDRQYLLHVPRGYKKRQKKTLPLVIMLHGRTSNGRAAASRYYGWTPLADKEKFFAVFPTALGKPTSWQGGWAGKPTVDTKFLSQLIDTLLKDFRIDKERVFMTGHSSGGFMSYSFASTHSEKIAAIGPVAGLAVSKQKSKLPVSVISFHGMADDVVAYDSKNGKKARYRGMPSAMESAATFADHNGCAKQSKRTELAKGKVHLDTWADGKAGTEVLLYSIEGGDHGWPNGRGPLGATKIIWEFFKEHGRGTAQSKKSKKKKRRTIK
ncbi:MAG: PHB depolymerase family esterase [Planctomycetota bacterium]|nr:PHB depolymerase family esterase [Planctomycetota bacterium]